MVLEPVWMLLPFAGFLYGSVLRIEMLSRDPTTAWLTHFVFPVLSIGVAGPVLSLLGLLVFLVGATQIYAAKIRRTGLVTGGLYRFVRHPQYIALTLFGLGILLTWGRAIAYVGFFLMLWLYYWLSKHEERRCRALFGADYEAYRARTSFVFPGDRRLALLAGRAGIGRWPAPVRALGGLALALLLCFGSMAAIVAVKRAARTVPFVVLDLGLPETASAATPGTTAESAAGLAFVRAGRLAVVRGPYRNAAAPGFAEAALARIRTSAALASFLAFLDEPDGDAALAFGVPFDRPEGSGPPAAARGPGSGDGRGPSPDPAGPDRVRLVIFRLTLAPGATIADALADLAKRTLRGAAIVPVDLARPTEEDVVVGEVFRPGPMFAAESRWSALAAPSRGADATASAVAEPHRSARLVLVKAPVLRMRIDDAFAARVKRRIVASASLRERLARMGAGGRVVPVVFPRPGENWYREHGDRARLSLFVVLVRTAAEGAPPASLFAGSPPDVAGAFTAELDLAVEPPGDPVGRVETIGPGRGVGERWDFFLSGL